jgi:hypothetical protein
VLTPIVVNVSGSVSVAFDLQTAGLEVHGK